MLSVRYLAVCMCVCEELGNLIRFKTCHFLCLICKSVASEFENKQSEKLR